MKRAFLYFICLGCISLTFASGSPTATVSWTAPVAYSDGSNLPASDIDHYTITWAPTSEQSGPSGSLNTIPAAANTTVVPIACGSTSFTVSVTTTASARYPNATSSSTAAVPFATGIACTPNPPSGLAVH